jgi:vancomycin permeability regulator SanA
MLSLKRFVLIWAVWFVIHSVYTVIDGLSGSDGIADVAIVTGGGVNSDGTLSNRLKAKVDLAYDLLKEGKVKSIVVSGGLSKPNYQEAEVMKTYLIAKGVHDSLILVDNLGSNTQATVENTIQSSKQNNWKSIVIISQYYHMTRAKMLYRKEGFKQVKGLAPNYFMWHDVFFIFREFWAFYVGLI